MGGEEKKEEEKKEEEKKEEEEEKEEEFEDLGEEPPKVELSEEEKKINFTPNRRLNDLTPPAFSASFPKYAIPEKDEGFDDVSFAWDPAPKSAEYLKEWIADKKMTVRLEDPKPRPRRKPRRRPRRKRKVQRKPRRE